MSILCKLFGHRPDQGYTKQDGSGYFAVHPGTIDGLGVVHASLITTCCRCGAQYVVGKIHVPKSSAAIAKTKERERCLALGNALLQPNPLSNYNRALRDYQRAIRGGEL